MLATDIIQKLNRQSTEVHAFDEFELDILDSSNVEQKIKSIMPDLFINCAAYTAVDNCEKEEIAIKINGESLKHISKICAKYKVRLVHFSTDYIFSGVYFKPILEEEIPKPINKYGEGKLLGEKYIREQKGLDYLILRVQWLYGKNGKNFVDTILKLSKEKSELKIVNDQIGRPTSTKFLADVVWEAITKDLSGTYHAGPKDYCSWFEFAEYFLRNSNCKLIPIPSSDYPMPAKRPLFSVLDISKLENVLKSDLLQTTWKQLVDEYMERF